MNAISPDFAFDSLDRYRLSVEELLAAREVFVAEEVLERFFDHVIAEFERGKNAAECASAWLKRTGEQAA